MRPHRLALPGLVLLAALLACGLPGAAPIPATPGPLVPSADAGPEEPAAVPPEATEPWRMEGPPPPPSGIVDSIQAGVAAGTWTYEQGLLLSLRVLAGELGVEEAFGAAAPADSEATGVLLDTRAYLNAVPEAENRSEIERLYHLLVPDVESLLPYSRPASTSSIRPPGLAAPVADSEACATLYKEGFPPGSKLTCFVYLTTPLGGNMARVFYPEAWGPSDPRLPYAHAAGQAIVDAHGVFAGFGKMQDVVLVFTLLKYGGKESLAALVDSLGGQSTCTIAVFPLAMSESEKSFKQLVAHEMFHCYQQWNYPSHFPVSDTDGSWSVQDWWGESTADFFSNLVYPKVNREWHTLGAFNAKSATDSLVYMSYENSVFFQFLANKTSPTAILELIKTLPTSGNEDSHATALAKYPNIGALFHEFGRAFVDGMIFDTGTPTRVPTGILKVPTKDQMGIGPSDHTVSLMPAPAFSLRRYVLAFKPDQVYANSTSESGLGTYGTRLLAGSAMAGGWSPVPPTISASCGPTQLYVLLTSPDAPADSYTVSVTSDKTAETLCDPCLHATWNLDPQSFAEYLEAPFLQSPGFFDLKSNAGTWQYTFRKTGVLEAQFQYGVAYSLHQGSEVLPLETDVVMSIEGSGSGIYSIPEPNRLALQAIDPHFSVDQVMWINGQEAEVPITNAFNPIPGSGALLDYTCSGNTLTLDFAPAVPLLPPVTFHRGP